MAQDEQGIKDICDPEFDAHCFTASELCQIPLLEILQGVREGDKTFKKMRQDAKADTFKPLYYGSSGTPAQQRYYAAWRERYCGINGMQKEWISEVQVTKRLITPYGLRFYWPWSRTSKSGYLNVSTAVCNYPVQGFATAEIMPIADVAHWPGS